MPLIISADGSLVLRCINHALMSHQGASGMRAEDAWLTLMGMVPKMPPSPGVPVAWTEGPHIDLRRGQVVRSYTCHVCGYVEMYDGAIIDPATWGGA